jgi:hypothetical protein
LNSFVALAPLIEPLIEKDWAQVPADRQCMALKAGMAITTMK